MQSSRAQLFLSNGPDGNARDMNQFGRDAVLLQAERHLRVGDEIPRHMLMHPHLVQVEIRHLHPHGALQAAARDELRQDFCRQEDVDVGSRDRCAIGVCAKRLGGAGMAGAG